MITTEAATAVAITVLFLFVVSWVIVRSLVEFAAVLIDAALWVANRRARRGMRVLQRRVGG